VGTVLLLFLSSSTYSDSVWSQRKEVQTFISEMVNNYHFDRKELTKTLDLVQLQPHVIESMEKPYEKKNWTTYSALFLTPERVHKGIAFWKNNQKILGEVQKKYGVPPEVLVAILGVETFYGEQQGEHKVLDALATLAFNYPKRAEFFRKELQEYLLICREQNVQATHYKGSYAGAFGKPQFIPSSYRHYAVDYQHKGHSDLVTNNEDSIASIANYLYRNGWKVNDGIAQNARMSAKAIQAIQVNPLKANYSYIQLMNLGIHPVTAAHNHPNKVGIIELITDKDKEYWLAYPNFFVLTRYNSSPQYALVVYLLSRQLNQQWTQMAVNKHRAYA